MNIKALNELLLRVFTSGSPAGNDGRNASAFVIRLIGVVALNMDRMYVEQCVCSALPGKTAKVFLCLDDISMLCVSFEFSDGQDFEAFGQRLVSFEIKEFVDQVVTRFHGSVFLVSA